MRVEIATPGPSRLSARDGIGFQWPRGLLEAGPEAIPILPRSLPDRGLAHGRERVRHTEREQTRAARQGAPQQRRSMYHDFEPDASLATQILRTTGPDAYGIRVALRSSCSRHASTLVKRWPTPCSLRGRPGRRAALLQLLSCWGNGGRSLETRLRQHKRSLVETGMTTYACECGVRETPPIASRLVAATRLPVERREKRHSVREAVCMRAFVNTVHDALPNGCRGAHRSRHRRMNAFRYAGEATDRTSRLPFSKTAKSRRGNANNCMLGYDLSTAGLRPNWLPGGAALLSCCKSSK